MEHQHGNPLGFSSKDSLVRGSVVLPNIHQGKQGRKQPQLTYIHVSINVWCIIIMLRSHMGMQMDGVGQIKWVTNVDGDLSLPINKAAQTPRPLHPALSSQLLSHVCNPSAWVPDLLCTIPTVQPTGASPPIHPICYLVYEVIPPTRPPSNVKNVKTSNLPFSAISFHSRQLRSTPTR